MIDVSAWVVDAFDSVCDNSLPVFVGFQALLVVSFQIADHMSWIAKASISVADATLRRLASCFAIFVCLAVSSPGFAQDILIEEDPDRRRILTILQDLEDITPDNYSRLADAFDAAWALAVRSEDPLLNLTTDREQSLEPGTSELDAGARYRLSRVFMKSPEAFRQIYQDQVKSEAEAAFGQALQSANLGQLEAVVQRFQFTQVANRGLQHLVQLRRSRGEYLQAALQHSRLMSLNPNVDQRHRILQIQLWYQAGLADDGLDELTDLLGSSAGSEKEVLQLIASILKIEADLPDSPLTRESLSEWIETGMSSRSQDEQLRSPEIVAGQQSGKPSLDFLQPLGNGRRTQSNAMLLAGQLETAWQQSTFSLLEAVEFNSGLEGLAEDLKNAVPTAFSMNETIAPIASPIVVGDRLILRCAMNLRALNLKTGEPLWESFLLDRHLRSMLEGQRDPQMVAFNRMNSQRPFDTSRLYSHWIQTNTGGQLTTDGRTVFAVEDVMSETLRDDAARQLEVSRFPSNYLRAYDVETGRLRAQAGGTVGINGVSGAVNPLAGMYFLGAPLVLADRIYVIAEAEPGIYLLQLKATPLFGPADEFQLQPVFSQLLSVPRFPLRLHPVRNQAGIVPSYGRGLIICSTCDEHIIAISAEDHSVRWIYRYPTIVSSTELGPPQGSISGAMGSRDSSRFDRRARWTDCLPRIINDKIIVTPRDSDELLCLDLQTGEEVWTMPRGMFRTIATVDQQKVVVSGANIVSAFRLSDGEEIWSTKIQDGQVCGSGYSDGTTLQLPTSRPGILALRLSDGQQLLHQDTDRLPGNLISNGEAFISQSVTGVQRLTMAKSENQPLLAARKMLIEGNLPDATILLRQAIEQSGGPESRRIAQSQFVAATLNALRANNKVAKDMVPEAEEMLLELRARDEVLPLLFAQGIGIPPISPAFQRFRDLERADQQWAELQELMTRGSLQDLNEPAVVVASRILELLRRGWTQRQDIIHDTYRIVRKERLVFQQVRSAIEQRDPKRQAELKVRLRELLVEQLASGLTAAESRWWLNACLMINMTSPAADFVIGKSTVPPGIQDAFADLVVRHHVERAASESAAQTLMGRLKGNEQFDALGDLLLTTKEHRSWQDELSKTDSAGSILAAGRFSVEMLSNVDLDSKLTELSERQTPLHWLGVPDVVESDAHSATGPPAMDSIGSVAEDLPVFDSNNQYRHWNFLVETTRKLGPLNPVMNAYDAQGTLRWTHPLGTERRVRFGLARNPTLEQYVVGLGQLVLLRRATEITMLDCSQATQEVAPEVLWKKSLSEFRIQGPFISPRVSSWERTTVYDRQPTGLAPAGPISAFGLPIVLGADLLVVDPVSGVEQWHVTGLAEDCSVTVRGDRLYLMSQSSSQVEIRSLIDGTVIATRSIPDWWRDAEENSTTTPHYLELDGNDSIPIRIQVSDGNCVLYRYGLEKVTLESYNLDSSDVNWSREFPGESAVSNVCGGVVAVLSTGNRLQLVDTTTGAVKEAVELSMVAEEIQYLYLRRSAGRWLVITDQFDQDHDEQNPVSQSVIVNGAVHCLTPIDGKLAWSYPIKHEHIRIRRPGSRQPAIPPVAPFLTLLKRPSPEVDELGMRRGRTLYQTKILDVRTGKVLYSDPDVGFTLSNFYLKLQPAENRILLNFDKRSVTFDYSGSRPSKPQPERAILEP